MTVDFRLYLITDRALFGGSDGLLTGVEEALKGGVRAVQLREKDLPTRPLLALAYKMKALTAAYRAKLFINDRADIALCVGADGVHLGQTGMPPSAVRKVVGEGMLIGVSTHSLAEAKEAAEEGADFITYGPLYPTPSKLKYGAPVGVASLRTVAAGTQLPVFGIGGIKRETAAEVMAEGAFGIALISGILAEGDITGAAEYYLHQAGERA